MYHEVKAFCSDLYRAVVLAQRYTPKGFVDVSAEEFLECPENGYEGEWVERESRILSLSLSTQILRSLN